MKKFLFLSLMSVFAACTIHAQSLTSYVNPLIGSGGHGHVFVGANVPFGFVQLGPTSIPEKWDWCSGYHRSDSTVIGFSHTHLSGTGIGDLFDVTLMPVIGEVKYARGEESDPQSGLWSYQDRKQEKVCPGYYTTYLTRYGIKAEMTATCRTGISRYTFPASEEAAIVIDLQNGGCWDKATQTYLEAIDDHSVQGYRFSKGWAKDQKVFFYAEFSKPFKSFTTDSLRYGRADFSTTDGEKLLVKVALSPTSMSDARNNMAAELSNWDFEGVRTKADGEWNKMLAKVTAKSSDPKKLRILYTALYHTMIAPSTFSNVDGSYMGSDKCIHRNADFQNYTTFSLWDTYRAAHPLMTILHQERMPDIINTMLHIYKEQGKLPVWHLMANETDCMVGNPGIPVVADAVLKDIKGFDQNLALEAMERSALLDERGLKEYREFGYIPYEQGPENVARTMEYGLADWALAQAARKLGKMQTYEYFNNRSKAYQKLFDPSVGFVRARSKDGKTWRTPFSPFKIAHEVDDYTEGNAWQYTWLVPHDLGGLVKCFGGKKQFLTKLDSLFVVTGDLGEAAPPDISGLIGQYAHGNEPSHHILYFYTMLGKPGKTAELVRKVLTEQYFDGYEGLSGNEDVGQMSAWYVLSSLGFYQVEPAGGRYVFGYPNFEEVTLNLQGGKTFTVKARGLSDKNCYIQKVLLNGKPLKKYWIDHKDIVKGGTLEYIMGSKPAKWY